MTILIKLLILTGSAFTIATIYFNLIRGKPRKKSKEVKISYEIMVMIVGLMIASYGWWRFLAGESPTLYISISMGGIFMTLIHVVSNISGRYDGTY